MPSGPKRTLHVSSFVLQQILEVLDELKFGLYPKRKAEVFLQLLFYFLSIGNWKHGNIKTGNMVKKLVTSKCMKRGLKPVIKISNNLFI